MPRPWAFLLLSGFSGLLSSRVATAQQATLADCVQIIKGDSVAMFYNSAYVMTPAACANIRRHTRINAKGEFYGEVLDYQMNGSRLLVRMRYADGRRHGLYEQYYPSGKRLLKGQFANGVPTGQWSYWYENGQPKQTLEWPADRSALRIVASWDTTGQQQATGGTGTWHDVLPGLPRRYGGPVLDGYAHGTWESRDTRTGKLYTTERYDHGRFVSGKAFDGQSFTYKTDPLLGIRLDDPTSQAEAMRFTSTCAAMRTSAAVGQRFGPAFYRGGNAAYSELLWQRIRPLLNGSTPLGSYSGVFRFNVRLDAQGNWQNEPNQTEGTNLEAARQMLNLLRVLPRWAPANLDGQPVASLFTVTFQAIAPSYSINLQPGRQPLAEGATP